MIDEGYIDREVAAANIDEGCIDREVAVSKIDEGYIDREVAAANIDEGYIDREVAGRTIDDALIDRLGQRHSVDAGCIDDAITRNPASTFAVNIDGFMVEDDPKPDDVPQTKPAVSTNDVPDLAPDALVIAAHPNALIRGFRFLQQRIPGFTQLSAEEERALIRVASLDPDFVEACIRAASACDDTKAFVGLSAEELRQELDEARQWDEAESEVRALLKGMSAANRKRRHRLGQAVLNVYFFFGTMIHNESYRHLRPYYEEMKRAYRDRKRKRRKTEKE